MLKGLGKQYRDKKFKVLGQLITDHSIADFVRHELRQLSHNHVQDAQDEEDEYENSYANYKSIIYT